MNTQANPDFIKELNSLIAKEAARHQTEELQETDWTIERVMEEHDLSSNQARKLLNKLATEGHFVKIRIDNPSGSGAARVAYRPIEKKKK